ncbi:MAG: hypothetical protein WC438_03055 [Candidatus Pacearchaeota archaeon]
MGDLASDHDNAISLVIEGYQKLKSLNPQHELLQYFSQKEDNLEWIEDKQDAFFNKFEDPEDKKLDYVKMAKVFASYFCALKKAVDKIEGIPTDPIKGLEKVADVPF